MNARTVLDIHPNIVKAVSFSCYSGLDRFLRVEATMKEGDTTAGIHLGHDPEMHCSRNLVAGKI